MIKFVDLTGSVFGSWTVLSFEGVGPSRSFIWKCRCKCGYESIMASAQLKRATMCKSCVRIVHGHSSRRKAVSNFGAYRHSDEYSSWRAMLNRCYNKRTHSNRWYAKIEVHQPWRDSFVAFLADVGPRPSKQHTLDRIDGTKGYFPGNVRWATWDEQGRNKSNNVFIEFNGERMILAEWARRLGLDAKTVSYRLKHWSIERALQPKKVCG